MQSADCRLQIYCRADSSSSILHSAFCTLHSAIVAALVATTVLGWAASVHAQGLSERIAASPDGRIRFTFAAQPDVCGHGTNIIHVTDESDDWEAVCDSGTVRVVLTKTNGALEHMRWYVGGRWKPAASNVTDLGNAPVVEATQLLLDLARGDDPDVARRAVYAAAVADSVDIWSDLAGIARNGRSQRVRRTALEQLGMLASRLLAPEADRAEARDDQSEARKKAVFALSQLPKTESVPRLIRIARENAFAHVRREALFWLSQSRDERAIEVIEDIFRQR